MKLLQQHFKANVLGDRIPGIRVNVEDLKNIYCCNIVLKANLLLWSVCP